jgi:RNA polymerase sigma-70 factor (ECF subfamily)
VVAVAVCAGSGGYPPTAAAGSGRDAAGRQKMGQMTRGGDDGAGELTGVPAAADELLAAARHGDEDAYRQLMAPHRAGLHAHCYRMLGSNSDAEDALQETLLRAWRGLGRFQGRSSVRSWLYRIATNACLRLIEGRPTRVLPIDYGPAADPHQDPGAPLTEAGWIEPYPEHNLATGDALTPEGRYEQRESVELAFVAALQYLPAGQRAALILRDVLGFSGAETARMLQTTPTSVYSSLQRAHKTVSERVPHPSQQATLRALGSDEQRAIVGRYVQAWQLGDVAGIVKLLTDDATLSMPPIPSWFRGPDAIGAFLARHPLVAHNRWRLVPTRANSQLATGYYLWDDTSGSFGAHSLSVLTLRGDRIAAVTAFFVPDSFALFGLPEQLPG